MLRNAGGIRAEMYLGNPKHNLGQQMKYADDAAVRRARSSGARTGTRERRGSGIKDLILGAGTLTSIKDRDEYLKKQAEVQFALPRGRDGRGGPQTPRAPRADAGPQRDAHSFSRVSPGLTRSTAGFFERQRQRSLAWSLTRRRHESSSDLLVESACSIGGWPGVLLHVLWSARSDAKSGSTASLQCRAGTSAGRASAGSRRTVLTVAPCASAAPDIASTNAPARTTIFFMCGASTPCSANVSQRRNVVCVPIHSAAHGHAHTRASTPVTRPGVVSKTD